MDWVNRYCPLCSSDKSKAEITAPIQAESNSFNSLVSYWRGFRNKSCFFTYFRCENCGLLYNKVYFNTSQLQSLYSSMPDNSAGVNLNVLSKTQLGYLNFFLNNSDGSHPIKLLEIGPDVGLFTHHADNSNIFNSISLVEPNSNVHDVLLKSITKTESVFLYDNLTNLPNTEKFDLIVGIHVFDHLIDPTDYIDKIKSHLNPGGYILSVTHDEHSLLRKLLKQKWIPFCLQHPQLSNFKTIEKLFTKSGFKVVRISKSVNWFPLSHLINTLLSLLNLPKLNINYLDKINLPVKLGNMISLFRLEF